MLNQTGIPTLEQVLSRFPERKELVKAKAIIECYEDIPCNPCETSCPVNAIYIGKNINKQPVLDVEKCIGCGFCVEACPGLAIILAQIKAEKALFTIPYEFRPLPTKGEIWFGVDRSGKVICEVKIKRVVLAKRQDHTAVVTVSVPAEYLYQFITIRVKQNE
ncbi:MAG TPA: 4Fe-4S dicluster domain-containing protein [Bacilli bacterium]|jgi:Fe-S-cluster-containing hydrogenase component 2|nr:4Fe-4S dicluster domain-containing protein [Acholeplasmataceae bacterium]HHY22068.1 4Fe-4S dicluster domain-containing protein [Bacilli bacterium]